MPLGDLKITVLAAGQGMCSLVERYDTDGNLIFLAMMDCGAENGRQLVDLENNNIEFIRNKMRLRAGSVPAANLNYLIDLVVISHGDADHCNWLKKVFAEMKRVDNGKIIETDHFFLRDISAVFNADGGRLYFHGVETHWYHIRSNPTLDETDFMLTIYSDDTQSILTHQSKSFTGMTMNPTHNAISYTLSFSQSVFFELSIRCFGMRENAQWRDTTFLISAKYTGNKSILVKFECLHDEKGDEYSCEMPFDLTDRSEKGCGDEACNTFNIMLKTHKFFNQNQKKRAGDIVAFVKKLIAVQFCTPFTFGDTEAWDAYDKAVSRTAAFETCRIGNFCMGGETDFSKDPLLEWYNLPPVSWNFVTPLLAIADDYMAYDFKADAAPLKYPAAELAFELIQVDSSSIDEICFSPENSMSLIASVRPTQDDLNPWVLFPGDATYITMNYFNTHANSKFSNPQVLIAPHHGSITTSAPLVGGKIDLTDLNNFIYRVDPSQIIITAGYNNSFGHPHKTAAILFRDYMKQRGRIMETKHQFLCYPVDRKHCDAVPYLFAATQFPIYASASTNGIDSILRYYQFEGTVSSAGAFTLKSEEVFDTKCQVDKWDNFDEEPSPDMEAPVPSAPVALGFRPDFVRER